MALLDAGQTGLPEVEPGRMHRLWHLRFRWHIASLGVMLLALFPLMAPGSSFTSDEGAYALQAEALEHGSWAYDYRAAPLDPDGAHFPIGHSAHSGDSYFTYVTHPVYPVLLLAGRRLVGPILGLHLLPLIGAAAAAAAAWLLAAQFDRASSRLAFWLAAASPVVANGYLLWAHSVSAALAGLAIAAAVRIVRRGATPLLVGGLGVALAAGALVRSEAVLFALVVALAVAAFRVRSSGIPSALVTLVALAGPMALSVLIERRWVAAILAGPSHNLDFRGEASPYLSGRITGAWHELVNDQYGDAASALPVLLTLGLTVGLGFLALRRWRSRSRRDLLVLALVVVAAVTVRMTMFPRETVTGLLAAWPLGLLGVVLLPRRQRDSGRSLVLVIVVGFLAAVLLTQYPEGGGYEWGGRFLSPLVVPLAVMAAIGLRHRLVAVPQPDRRWAAGCLSVVAVATAVLGLFTIAGGRARHDRVIAAASRYPAPVTVTTVQALPRIAWRSDRQLTWMLTDDAGLSALLGRLGDQGLSELAVVTGHGADASGWPDGWSGREVVEPGLLDAGLGLFLLRR